MFSLPLYFVYHTVSPHCILIRFVSSFNTYLLFILYENTRASLASSTCLMFDVCILVLIAVFVLWTPTKCLASFSILDFVLFYSSLQTNINKHRQLKWSTLLFYHFFSSSNHSILFFHAFLNWTGWDIKNQYFCWKFLKTQRNLNFDHHFRLIDHTLFPAQVNQLELVYRS